MVLGTGRERPLSVGLHTDGYPEARFESVSLHQPRSLLTSSQAASKPETDTLLPSVSGAYSPWSVSRPHLEPMARRAGT